MSFLETPDARLSNFFYMSKLHPLCPAFWQKPREVTSDDLVPSFVGENVQ